MLQDSFEIMSDIHFLDIFKIYSRRTSLIKHGHVGPGTETAVGSGTSAGVRIFPKDMKWVPGNVRKENRLWMKRCHVMTS